MWEVLKTKLKPRGATPTKAARADSPAKARRAVNFKDFHLPLESESDSGEDEGGGTAGQLDLRRPSIPKPINRIERTKQVIIMVGLPGRGKTFLCNKLRCYLNWLGHNTKHINVGSYRRAQKAEGEVQGADFFDHRNQHGIGMRSQAVNAALADMDAFLGSADGQVVIFDATNTTEERRQIMIKHCHGRYQYLFIESICNDQHVLEQNYLFKMRFSPDYKGVDEAAGLADFKARVAKYEEVYEPLSDRNVHYIKLIDMVTGRGHMDVNRISGYIAGKIVFFLMQICKAGMAQSRKIWLTRHGESEFNEKGLIGGDSGLSQRGHEYACMLPDAVINRLPLTFDDDPAAVSVWTSTLKRTIQTAGYLPFPKLRWKALDEIHAGSCDGLSYAEIEKRFPEEFEARAADKLRYRYPAGESYMDVIQRLEPVIIEMERERECVCVVAHQAVLRAVLGYFTNAPLDTIPTLQIPLHTIVELRPRPDGTMEVEQLPVALSGHWQESAAPSHLPPPALPVQVPLGTTGEQVLEKCHTRIRNWQRLSSNGAGPSGSDRIASSYQHAGWQGPEASELVQMRPLLHKRASSIPTDRELDAMSPPSWHAQQAQHAHHSDELRNSGGDAFCPAAPVSRAAA
uniref:6-phosphofructo-2-kinase domain-containing protein n=1 Tax=Chlamydomonas euryale TaxID=1486919 RepID=A0A7R9VHD7_9CHLO|mmetsp:Transcript_34210/g.101670  ORF Transcript_34210/g.101670 Transcript_34210/m.101670 type:complete len:628 (+) Transcript_34210:459-2342(+)